MVMYDNGVIIETVFVRFDLPKVDNINCHDYNPQFLPLRHLKYNFVNILSN